MFVNRQAELAFLNSLLTRSRPGPGQLILLYGRRRIGKTALLRHWASTSGIPSTYWVAERELATMQRRRFSARLLGVPVQEAPIFESWPDLWVSTAALLAGKQHILMLDELPYAVESDGGMLSALQNAWDAVFQQSQVLFFLCGSQIHTMETMLEGNSPLFGRMTGQWLLRPLRFGNLPTFLPHWSPDELVAIYAIVGGVPAYLAWLDPQRGLVENIRQIILAPGSQFLSEPTLILSDELRDPRSYRSIIQAIGSGAHTLNDISTNAFIAKSHVPAYLARLQELRLVERRIPATVPPSERHRTRAGRYHLSDPFFRFYFRFIASMQEDINYEPEKVIQSIQQGLRAFVGLTAWEALAGEWVRVAGRNGTLDWSPQVIGSHWSRTVQVDVVAIDWTAHHILLGECKWGTDAVSRTIVRELIGTKAPRILADLPDGGRGWQVTYALFARAGATDAAIQELTAHGGMVIDLNRLMLDLAAEDAEDDH
jgi:AAA+ ATPase superfamily predicted ATPase